MKNNILCQFFFISLVSSCVIIRIMYSEPVIIVKKNENFMIMTGSSSLTYLHIIIQFFHTLIFKKCLTELTDSSCQSQGTLEIPEWCLVSRDIKVFVSI